GFSVSSRRTLGDRLCHGNRTVCVAGRTNTIAHGLCAHGHPSLHRLPRVGSAAPATPHQSATGRRHKDGVYRRLVQAGDRMVTSPEDNGLRHMSDLDHLNIRRARPEDVETIASFSAAMAQETEGRCLDLDRLLLGTIALIETPARGFFMVAELEQADDRPLLGQLMVTYEWSDWRNGAFGGFRVCMWIPPGDGKESIGGCMIPSLRWAKPIKRCAVLDCTWHETIERPEPCTGGLV